METAASFFYSVTGLCLFSIGLGGLVICAHLLQKILAANIMASGVFLLLVTIAFGSGTTIDPIPHAMVLTGIVVSVSCTGLALALFCRVHDKTKLVRRRAEVKKKRSPHA